MDAVELEKIDPTRGMRRYYRLWLRPDLFAPVCLVREWGRIGHAGGKVRIEPFEDVETAQAALERVAVAKRQKGYQPPKERPLGGDTTNASVMGVARPAFVSPLLR
jgi:predicted DNA-binding WGR domain protein